MDGYLNYEVFSPVRTDSSFNETPYNSRRDSGSMSEYLIGSGLDMEKNAGNLMSPKRNNLLETVHTRNKVNGSKEQVFNISKIGEETKHLAVVSKDTMALNYGEVSFGNFETSFGMEIDIPENKFPYVTRRSGSSQSRKELQEMNYKSAKGKQARHHYNDGLYQTSRSDGNKGREQPYDKLSVSPTQYPAKYATNYSEKKPVEVIDLDIDICDISPKSKDSEFGINNEAQTEIPMPDLSCETEALPMSKRNYESSADEINLPAPILPSYFSQPQQIQGNIIEKLIKDTVSFEFDAIRQLLYLQHISLLRHLHKTLEVFENQNSSNCEFMLKVIEELMQENRQLKNAVLAHQKKI